MKYQVLVLDLDGTLTNSKKEITAPTKQALLENEELSRHLQEFRAKNYDLQNRQGVNPYDEMIELTREYDELLHNSVVSDFLQAEQQICKLLQQVFDSIAEGLEFDYINE